MTAWKTSFENKLFFFKLRWLVRLNMGLTNKVDAVCFSPVIQYYSEVWCIADVIVQAEYKDGYLRQMN